MTTTTLPKILIGVAVAGIFLIGILLIRQSNQVNHFILSKEGGYFVLTANPSNQQSFDVSNWKIGTDPTNSIELGEAIQVFRIGQIANLEPIILAPGERLVINYGQSPLGDSFRLQQCSGLLAQFQNFEPPLSASIEFGTDYLTCLDRHLVEPNFFLPEWRVYLNQSTAPIWWDKNLIKVFNNDKIMAWF